MIHNHYGGRVGFFAQTMYAKVFSQIFDSSIADDYHLRHFFTDLLVLADINGVVDMTPTAISARTRIPIEEVARCISILEKPDRESRTPEHDGRRIAKLDEHRSWGWVIINYDRFRAIASDEQRREKNRKRVQKYREKKACNAAVTPCNAVSRMSRHAEAEAEANAEAHTHAESVRAEEKGLEASGNGEYESFVLELLAFYKRRPGTHLTFVEQSSIAEIVRCRQFWKDEWSTIKTLRDKEGRYFPQSLSKLISNWQETLDRAANHVPEGRPVKTIMDKEIDSIERQISRL